MDNQVWLEGFGEDDGDALKQESPEEIDLESKWDFWHSGFWRIDMDEPCERDIEIEPVRIYEGPFSNILFQIRFDEQLTDEEIKKHLRALECWIDGGGLAAIRG